MRKRSYHDCTNEIPSVPSRRLAVPVEWRHYDRVQPSEYDAVCLRSLVYYDHHYKRHTCLLIWTLLSSAGESVGTVRQWLNLGNAKTPRASRRSKYWMAWIAANSGRPPVRNDRLSPKIFTRRIARVLVGDTTASPNYSVVREVLAWKTGVPENTSRSSTQSLNTQGRQGVSRSTSKELRTAHVGMRTSALAGVKGDQANHNPRADGASNTVRKGRIVHAVGRWLNKTCIVGPQFSCATRFLLREFKDSGVHATREEFDATLRDLGFAVVGDFANGLVLKTDVTQTERK